MLTRFLTTLLFVALAAPADGPRNEQAFIGDFRRAVEAGDVSALASMVHWADAPANVRSTTEQMLKNLTKSKLADVKIVPAAAGDFQGYAAEGKQFEINLKPIGKLVVETVDAKGVRGPALAMPVGVSEGVYKFGVAAPKAAAAPIPAAVKAPTALPGLAVKPGETGAPTDSDLLLAYQLAHDARDVEAALKLFDWTGKPASDQEFARSALKRSFSLPLRGVELHAQPERRMTATLESAPPAEYFIAARAGRRYLAFSKAPAPAPRRPGPEAPRAMGPSAPAGFDPAATVGVFARRFKGKVTLNGKDGCEFLATDAQGKSISCLVTSGKIRYGKNALEVEFERLGGGEATLELDVFRFDPQGLPEKLHQWNLSKEGKGRKTLEFEHKP